MLANSVDPDQTAPKGAVLSRSTLFAITATKFFTYSLIKPFNSITIDNMISWGVLIFIVTMLFPVTLKKQKDQLFSKDSSDS